MQIIGIILFALFGGFKDNVRYMFSKEQQKILNIKPKYLIYKNKDFRKIFYSAIFAYFHYKRFYGYPPNFREKQRIRKFLLVYFYRYFENLSES